MDQSPPHTIRKQRANVSVNGEWHNVPVYKPIGLKAWSQDSPSRERSCRRAFNAAHDAWYEEGIKQGNNRASFHGPVLALYMGCLIFSTTPIIYLSDATVVVSGVVKQRENHLYAMKEVDWGDWIRVLREGGWGISAITTISPE